jgi:hypothetical protein
MDVSDRYRVVLFVAMLTVLASVGCSKPVVRSRLVATYEIEHERGVETLTLRDDGTYSHRFKPEFGAESTHVEKWEFSADDGRPTVVLHNFQPHFPGNDWLKGAWKLGVKEDYGRIRFYVSSDPRQFYLEEPQK